MVLVYALLKATLLGLEVGAVLGQTPQQGRLRCCSLH